jgi:hypothetical protein
VIRTEQFAIAPDRHRADVNAGTAQPNKAEWLAANKPSLGFRIGNLAAKSRNSGFRAPPGTFFGRESH